MSLFLVAIGGALGAMARFGVSRWLDDPAGSGIPLATLSVNVVGAFALGLLLAATRAETAASEQLRLFLALGFLGSFTTFSTFSAELVRLAEGGTWLRSTAYAGVSVGLAVFGVVAGLRLGALFNKG